MKVVLLPPNPVKQRRLLIAPKVSGQRVARSCDRCLNHEPSVSVDATARHFIRCQSVALCSASVNANEISPNTNELAGRRHWKAITLRLLLVIHRRHRHPVASALTDEKDADSSV